MKTEDITTCYERGGQPEWDHNDYQRDFEYWGIDRSQPITLPVTDRSQPMLIRLHDQHCVWCDCEEFMSVRYGVLHHLSERALQAVKVDFAQHHE